MNKEEFLKRLEQLLSDISEEERADALAFYRSYFEDAGIGNEASILEELESPEKVAEVIKKDLGVSETAEAVEEAFRYGKIVLASTTYNGDVFPFMKTFIEHLTERNYQNKTIGLIENGSWASMAGKVMTGMFEKSKNITWLETSVKIMSSMDEQNKADIEKMAEELM